jgi:hypothetical protein
MKITLKNVELLGNPRFCTAEEAINFVQKEVGFPRWNDNYSISENIRFFGGGNKISKEAWSVVLSRSDVSPEKALEYMKKSNIEQVFGSVLKRLDIPQEKALEYTKNHSLGVSLWSLFLTRTDLSLQKVFSLIRKNKSELNHVLIADAVFGRDDVNNLSFDDLLSYLEMIDLEYFWRHLSKISSFFDYLLHENTSTEVLSAYVNNLSFFWFREFTMDYEKKKMYVEVVASLLLRKDFPYKRAIAFLDQTFMSHNEYDYTGNDLRRTLTKRVDIPAEEIVSLVKEWEVESILTAILKRPDVQAYLNP